MKYCVQGIKQDFYIGLAVIVLCVFCAVKVMCNGAGLWLVELFSCRWSLRMFTSEGTPSPTDISGAIASAVFASTHRRLAGNSLWHDWCVHDSASPRRGAAWLLHGSSRHREISLDACCSELSPHRWSVLQFTYPSLLASFTTDVILLTSSHTCLQCFDTVGWAAGRASGL